MPGPMQQKTDEELRKDRLRFYREEMSEINATLRGFLQRIEQQYGTAARIWLMDRGIPTEAVLAEMRASTPPISSHTRFSMLKNGVSVSPKPPSAIT